MSSEGDVSLVWGDEDEPMDSCADELAVSPSFSDWMARDDSSVSDSDYSMLEETLMPNKAASLEDANEYRPGGYHPVRLGDRYCDSRYEVVHKLGHGERSTVWLCLDHEARLENVARAWTPVSSGAGGYHDAAPVVREQWVALKIFKACCDHSRDEGVLSHVNYCHNLRQQHGRPRGALRHVNAGLASFTIYDGPNGSHFCLVLPLTAGSIKDLPYILDRREPDLLISVCRQVALGVEALHARKIYHGNLHPENVRFQVDGVEFTRRFRTAAAIMEWCDDLSVRFSGDPRTQHVDEEHAADAHRPPYLVLPLDMYIMQGSRLLDVVISSFGAAGFRGSKNDEAIFTARRVAYAAPELRLAAQHQHDGMSSDIWSLACIFFEMRLQRPCFVDFSSETGRVEQVAELERIFGPLPAMCRKQVLRVLAQPLYAEEGQEAVHKRARDYVEGKTDLPPFVALRYVKDFDSSGSGLYAFATLDDWIQRACLAAAKSGLPTALLRSIGRVSEYEVAGLTREAAWGLYGVEWEYRGDEMWVEIEAARVSPLPSSLPGSPAGASSQRLPKSAKAQKPSSAVAPKTSEAPVRRSERIRAKNEARVGAKASSTSIPKLAKPGRNKKAKGVSQDPPAASDSKKEAPSPGTPAHRRQIKEKRRASQSSRSPGTGSDAAVGSGPAPEERRIGWEHGSLLCYREQDGHPDPEKPRSSRAWEDIERMLRTDALRVDSGRVRGRRGHDGTLFEFQVPEAEAHVFGDLMGKMMKVDPGERIDIEEVLDHGWFDDNRLVGYLAKLQGPLDDSFPKRAQSFNEWLEYMYDVKKRWM